MKTLQITARDARLHYKTASPEFKTVLESSFGKDFFSQDICDRVQSYEDSCIENGTEPMNEMKLLSVGITRHEIIGRKLESITKALNEGKPIDIYNGKARYYPWFSCSPFAFRRSTDVCAYAGAGCGSRLSYHEKRESDYSGKQFADLWEAYLS